MRIERRIVAGVALVLGAPLLAAVALAQGPEQGRGDAAGTRPACVHAHAEPRMQAYGWDHFVVVRNGCEAAVTCRVVTDVNPSPTALEVPAGATRETLTWRGSPASAFSATVDCQPARGAR